MRERDIYIYIEIKESERGREGKREKEREVGKEGKTERERETIIYKERRERGIYMYIVYIVKGE